MVVHSSAPDVGALVTTLRSGESIVIDAADGLIEVTVQWFRRGKVSIRVEAPRHVRVDRKEVRRRKIAACVDAPANPVPAA
jgi:carbon storage regulator CsrA